MDDDSTFTEKACELIANIIKADRKPPVEIKTKHLPSYSLLSFYDFESIRVKCGKKVSFISLAESFKCFLPDYPSLTIKKIESDTLWTRIEFNSIEELSKLDTLFLKIYDKACMLGTSEFFSCCSRYVECSDNLKCVHPDIKFSRGCNYKKNLYNSKIFYGKNRNVF